MYNVLPPSSPDDPFDRHGRFHFLVHGVAIGIAASAAVPWLPESLRSVLGAGVVAWSGFGLAVSLVAPKLVFSGSWKTAASLLCILTGGTYLGSMAENTPFRGSGLITFLAAALVLGGLFTTYRESRRLCSNEADQTDERTER